MPIAPPRAHVLVTYIRRKRPPYCLLERYVRELQSYLSKIAGNMLDHLKERHVRTTCFDVRHLPRTLA